MQLRQTAHQGQSYPHAALGAVEAGLGLREQVEDARQRVRRYAHTAVQHAHGHCLALAPDGHFDATPPRCVLQRIAQQIVEDLLESHGVAGHDDRLMLRRQREVQLPLACLGAGLRDEALEQRGEVDGLALQRDLATRDARHVQQIVDQPRKDLDLSLDDREGAIGRCARVAVPRGELHGVADRAERIAQLVPQHGEERVALMERILELDDQLA
jgi:hypothetical protein